MGKAGRAAATRDKGTVFYLVRGDDSYARGEYDRAIDDYTKAIEHNPDNDNAYDTYWGRGDARYWKGEYGAAVADYSEAIKLNPNRSSAYNSLAWLQADCPDAKYRDGKNAILNANKAYELSSGGNWRCISTLASAYGECGDFDAAVEWATKAIEAAENQSADAQSISKAPLAWNYSSDANPTATSRGSSFATVTLSSQSPPALGERVPWTPIQAPTGRCDSDVSGPDGDPWRGGWGIAGCWGTATLCHQPPPLCPSHPAVPQPLSLTSESQNWTSGTGSAQWIEVDLGAVSSVG